jgi:hypothetical protein
MAAFLGGSVNLWKATVSFIVSVCLSFLPHGATRLLLGRFSFPKIFWENTLLSKIKRNKRQYSFRYNQQDATLYNILYSSRSCTCFRRFFRPSSGAQTVHTASGICQACLLLPLAWVSANWPTLAVAASKLDIYQMLYVQFELLTMGGKTAWNMYSIDSNKEYCITLHLVGYT